MKIDHLPEGPGVYRIVHRPTGMTYVGSTKRLRGRLSDQRSRLRTRSNESTLLQKWWTETSEDEWFVEVIYLGTDLRSVETDFIKKIPEHLRLNIIHGYLSSDGMDDAGRWGISQFHRNRDYKIRVLTGVRKRPRRKWAYSFIVLGRKYRKGGFATAEDAAAARATHLAEILGDQVV